MSAENGKITLVAAQRYARNWINMESIKTNELRAFTIRRDELEFLLLQMTISQCDATRMYLGYKDSLDPLEPGAPCLLMTGVEGFVPKMYLKETGITHNIPGTEKYFTYFPNDIFANDEHNEYVLDFAYPCPDTCQLSGLMDPPPITEEYES